MITVTHHGRRDTIYINLPDDGMHGIIEQLSRSLVIGWWCGSRGPA
jgi:hypothetical protein